jgi:hypothetical protein
MTSTRWLRSIGAVLLVLAGGAAAASAQQSDVRALLAARGLPADLVDGVAAVAADAAERGLPTSPIADKALEGWAKRAPAERILSVVQAFSTRMGDAQAALRGAGLAAPPGGVIAAAADAMGRGMSASQVSTVVRAGPGADAAPALHVAAALSSQGMGMDQAVTVVSAAIRDGRSSDQILEMPSAMRAMQAQGLPPTEIGRQLMEGGGRGPGGPGRGGPGSMGPGSGGPGPGGMQRPGGNRGPGSGSRPPGELPPPPGGGRGPN